MRAVVIGGSGQIGGWLLRHLADRGHEAEGTYASTPFPGLTPLDLDAIEPSAAADWLRDRRPDVVFYPAGFTWVDGCERDPARAFAANRDQPLNLAHAAADLGARFVYFSTDYVFDGLSGPYDEDAAPNPLNAYGRAKLEAERDLATLGETGLILRTSWVFGPERQGKNFAYQLVRSLRDRRPSICPDDQISSPSYAPDVALAAVRLAEAGVSGLLHVVGPEVLPRDRFAATLVEGFSLDASLVQSQPTDGSGPGAARPLNGGLLAHRLDRILPGSMRPLGEAIPDFLRRLDSSEGWTDPR